MTTYPKRSEVRQTAAARAKILKEHQREGSPVTDPAVLIDAAQAVAGDAKTDAGVLALAIISKTRAGSHAGALPEAALEELLPLEAEKLARTAQVLQKSAAAFRRLAARGKDAPEHAAGLFARTRAAWQFGYDGHPFTRETMVRLQLVRYFEKTSAPFASAVRRAFALIVKQGPAYMAWSAGFPALVCDLNRPAHRKLAHLVTETAHGEAVVITRPLEGAVRPLLARRMLVVEDPAGFFAAVTGFDAPAMLLERRLGGWTVTFAAARAPEKELANKHHPALARALAECFEEGAR